MGSYGEKRFSEKGYKILLLPDRVCPHLLNLLIYPGRIRKKTVHFFLLFDEDDLPGAGAKRADFTYESGCKKIHAKVFIVAAKDRHIAFSPVCSHLGCLVNWDTNRREFLCPCHGGRYSMEGEVIAGSPPGPLIRLSLEVREEKVYLGIKL